VDAKLPQSELAHAAQTRPALVAVDADADAVRVTARKASSLLKNLPLAKLMTLTTPMTNIGL
jgi:hypothetical protein